MAILMVVKSRLSAAIFSIYITCICITLGSGILRYHRKKIRKYEKLNCGGFRSIKGLQQWLYYLTYATQTRYASAFLTRQIFSIPELLGTLPYDSKHNCTNMNLIETSITNNHLGYCRYSSGQEFLIERYSRDKTEVIFSDGILDSDMNIGITFAFALGMVIFNLFLYLIPLPAFVKAKFRE